MITGHVSNLQAVVSVTIHLPHQPHLALDFVVDTGFTGYLMLPLPAVSALNLPFLEDVRANLADDQEVLLPVYGATIDWYGEARNVRVLAGGRRPLLGTAIILGHNLEVDFVDGGKVTIGRISQFHS